MDILVKRVKHDSQLSSIRTRVEISLIFLYAFGDFFQLEGLQVVRFSLRRDAPKGLICVCVFRAKLSINFGVSLLLQKRTKLFNKTRKGVWGNRFQSARD